MFEFEDLPESFDPEPQTVTESTPGFVRFGDVAGIVHHEGADRAPLAVVLVPGNPGIDGLVNGGKYHAQALGMLYIMKELKRRSVTFLSFDYEGVGMSAHGGPTSDAKKWHAPTEESFNKSVVDALAWARQHLSDNVVAVCWNFGACYAGDLAARADGIVQGLISISMGYNVYMAYKVRQDPVSVSLGNALKARYDFWNTGLKCKTLYVVGSMDKTMTPVGIVKRLIKERSDQGAGADIHIIDQTGMTMSNDEYFQLKASEGDVATACADWIEALQKDLAAAVDGKLLGA